MSDVNEQTGGDQAQGGDENGVEDWDGRDGDGGTSAAEAPSPD
jgi:hypothetical protein